MRNVRARVVVWMLASIFANISTTSAIFAEELTSKKSLSSLGMGLSGIRDWSTAFPYLDLMKTARDWYDWTLRSSDGIETDSSGWLKSVAPDIVPGTVFLTNVDSVPVVYEHYIVRWEGSGVLDYKWCVKSVSRAHGGDRLEVGKGSCLLRVIEFDPNDPIRNITIVPEKYISEFDQGEAFNPDFVSKVGQFRALRFMNWHATNNSKQGLWTDRALLSDRSYVEKGVPVEDMIRLANQTNSDPWFNISHLADENYMLEFAKLVKANLNPNLTSYIEHSNEVWNFIFEQTRYARENGESLWKNSKEPHYQWHGMRTARMCDIWKKQVFFDNPVRVNCVLASQAARKDLQLLKAAMECPQWQQKSKPCYQHGIDSISIAAYFSGCLDARNNKELEKKIIVWSGLGEKGLIKASQQALDGRFSDCQLSVKDMQDSYSVHADYAKELGLQLLAYEGGQHITSNLNATQESQSFVDLHVNLNRSPLMEDLYLENFANWAKAGGGLFMHFLDASSYTKHGSWGALEYITQKSSPKWNAIQKINKEKVLVGKLRD